MKRLFAIKAVAFFRTFIKINKMKSLVILCFFLLSTCNNNDDGVACTQEAKAGLNVTVSLGNLTTITGEGITVVAVDGSYSETLTYYDESNPVFSGAYEREGNYIITVSKEGFQTYTSGTITVTSDICHVIPKMIQVNLQPN